MRRPSLSFEAVRDLLAGVFSALPDQRKSAQVIYPLRDVLLSLFAMFFFQYPSLLEYQRRMKERTGQSNLATMFGVATIPSDTQVRELADGVPLEPVRAILPLLFERMRRAGWTNRLITRVDERPLYTLLLDGSEYFHSTKVDCPSCLRRRDRSGQIQYSHTVVAATIVKAGSHQVLPLDVEEVRNSDGSEKQDCEINAAKRLISRVRQEHRQLPVCVGGDDLYAHEPFIELVRQLRMQFVIVAKPESHRELFDWVEDLDRLGECVRGTWREGLGGRRQVFEYRIAQQVPLTQGGQVLVNFVEVWVRDRNGKQLYHNSWITDFAVTAANVATVFAIGRSRWKVENEQFNVQKNHGYHLEHNYGHGQQTLSMVCYLLNLLAFVTHLILDLGDRLYQQCRVGESRRGLWTVLQVLVCAVVVSDWPALLRHFLTQVRGST